MAVNYELARKYYDEAAKRGNNAAFNNIGCMYVEGKGVNKDYKEAIDWFMKAANLGNYYAMRNIGNLYKNGNGVEQSFDKAIEWYKKAIEFGYKIAGADIGDMYYYGRGVNRDYISAMNWYKKATDSAYANYMIGFMYQFGEGVPVNLDTALEYYKQAMVGGYYNENYLDDPTYRYAYNLFHKYKKYDEAVNAMKKYYTNEQLRHFVNAIYKNANEFDFPYNSLGISSYYLAPQVEVMVGSSDREAFNELENRIYEGRNEGYSKYQQSISSAINEYFENINIMIRKVTFVKYLVEKEEFKNELDSSNVSSSISYALTNVQIPMVYTSNYYISYKSENNGSFFSPCYTYNLSYNGDISQLEKEFIKNVSDNIASIHNQIKNLFISEIKNLLSKI